MSDNEHIASFTSDGKSHRFLYEIIVGGPNYRAEFGETCVAVASGDSMFYLLSSVSEYPLTDAGWQSFVSGQSLKLTNLDQSRRQQANAMLTDFWQRRHNHARQSVMHQSKPQSIDDLIAGRIKE